MKDSGPKPIGVLDKPVTNLDLDGIKNSLQKAGEILVNKFGKEQFSNDLGRQIKKAIIKMMLVPGSNYFISCDKVTIALHNEEGKNILTEVRLPGIPYQRGRIATVNQLGTFLGFKELE